VVKPDAGDFVGRDALLDIRDAGPDRKLVGFVAQERGIPRHDHPLATADGVQIGTVTSGTQSPTLEAGIGLGYVPNEPAYTQPGTNLRVDGRRSFAVQVAEPPFHKN
jgi:aminomethyltransferase